jgi:hypothetical protein
MDPNGYRPALVSIDGPQRIYLLLGGPDTITDATTRVGVGVAGPGRHYTSVVNVCKPGRHQVSPWL